MPTPLSQYMQHIRERERERKKNPDMMKSREITTVTEDWGLVLKFSDASVDES